MYGQKDLAYYNAYLSSLLVLEPEHYRYNGNLTAIHPIVFILPLDAARSVYLPRILLLHQREQKEHDSILNICIGGLL